MKTNVIRKSKQKEMVSSVEIQEKFISTPWQEHNIYMLANSSKLWDTDQGKAIDFGNLIHEMMAKINTKNDVESVVNQYVQEGVVNGIDSKLIKKNINNIVHHPDLVAYFSEDVVAYNEREIVAIDHQIIVPDRLVFHKNNELTIIDYKTGKPSKEHHQQLLKYEQVLKSMNFKILKKLLIYLGEDVLVEEVLSTS
ncbi:MAG: PD-(D/E)XK nuclease family protein [Polaribacter sp.]